MNREAGYFHNCLSVEERPEGLVPRRFTPSQQAHWDSMGEVRSSRARSCAGVTLRMHTGSGRLSFSYQVLSSCGEKMAFDLYEGGRLTASVTHFTSAGKGNVTFDRVFSGEAGREMEVVIYLPFTAELALSGFDFGEDAQAISKNGYAERILWLGDSISQGMHASHPSQTLTAILGRRWNREIVNQGVGGCGFKDIPEDFTYGDWHPDKLVVLLGTNDTGPALTMWESYAQRMGRCLEAACASFGAENIRMVTPFWRTDLIKPEIGEPFAKICGQLRREAERLEIPLTEGFASNPRCGDFFWDQRLHPNDTGFWTISEALENIIR